MSDLRPTSLGKFELLARIAKGGMAEIFLARQHDRVGLSRLVVVKRILPHLAEEPSFVEMFLEEARLAALINHSNVVQIYDVGESDGDFYIAMEYLDGPSVGLLARNARKTKVPLPPFVAAEIIAQACSGLHAAHELRDETGIALGLVHRDVSPHNLMLTRSGTVKLLDFGVAKAKDSAIKTNTGSVKGKFPYMSPEQCRGDDLDRRTDVFSLGVVFWELLCAERLFQRATDLMTLKAITEEPLPDPRERTPSLPEPLVAVLLHALTQERDTRFSSAADFGKAIRAAVAGLGERGGTEILGSYIEERHSAELELRAEKLREVARKPTGAAVPVVRGFDNAHGSGSASAARTNSQFPSVGSRSSVGSGRSGSSVVDLANRPTSIFTVDERPPSVSSSPRRARRWLWIALAALIVGLGSGLVYRFVLSPSRPPGPALRFGLAPVFHKAKVKLHFVDFLRYIERRVGRRVDLVVAKSYVDLRHRLVEGSLAVAAITPLQFVRLRAAHPDVPMLASVINEGARTYQAYLVVRAGSPIKTVAQVKGKRVCYVDKGSASGYLMARRDLRAHGVDPDKDFSGVRFSGSHSDVLRDLVARRCDVGATFSQAYRSARKLGIPGSALKILHVGAELPLEVICASPKIPEALRQRFREALLGFDPPRDIGRTMISDIHPITSFASPDPQAFAALAAADADERARVKTPSSAPSPSSQPLPLKEVHAPKRPAAKPH
ncbi:MAG: PhnD/SsuA/transferrin family substrate-binding protein [Deltaproteobacteria bacterium]|nr:PhnD/SsuA/transferrin family substrate-binding protein [Deltaproteobacteria bacterium]